MAYRITTDSTCDLPRSFYEERGVACLGLMFQLNEQEYCESPDLELTPRQFYDALRAGGSSSTTQINTYRFVEFIEPFLQAGEDVLHIAFSGGLSGTYESCLRGALELAEKYPDRKVVVIDSLCASMGEGLLVYYADENRKAGMSLEDNAAWVENHKLNLCHWFTVDDLMHLHRGGRVSKASAVLGGILGIKPILHVDDEGHLILVNKVRGRMGSIEALAKKVLETSYDDLKDQTVFISHGDCEQDAQKLADILRQKGGVKDIVMHEVGAVIGSHTGPGVIAVFFMGPQR